MHTEEVVLQTRVNDQWAYYQAKNIRRHMYDADAQLAALSGAQGARLADNFRRSAQQQRSEADKIQHDANDLEQETLAAARRAGYFDAAEIFLEIAIVLCSIALLAESLLFWRASFAATVIGVVIELWPLLHR
jgi:hypothetical protein